MTNLKWIAFAAVLASSSAYADKLRDLEAADGHDRGCGVIPGFYTQQVKECRDASAAQDRLCVGTLSCLDAGRVREDIAKAEDRLRNAETRLTTAKAERARAKTPADQKKSDAAVKTANDAVAGAKEARAKALATQSTLKKDNAEMALKIGKCLDARTAVLNVYQLAHDKLRKEKADKPADAAKVDNLVRSLGAKYDAEMATHKAEIEKRQGSKKNCEAHL